LLLVDDIRHCAEVLVGTAEQLVHERLRLGAWRGGRRVVWVWLLVLWEVEKGAEDLCGENDRDPVVGEASHCGEVCSV
jgi:hypothetical protein